MSIYEGTVVKSYLPSDPRLGRHIRHDPRSLNYLVEAGDISQLKSIRHERYIPILDQGNLGSCTGNAGTGNLGSQLFYNESLQTKTGLSGTDAFHDEQYAIQLYSAATLVDSYNGGYPPNDTGSDGLSVAQVLKNRGLISGYRHATSLEAVLTALASQPVIVGTEWRQDMFTPDEDGRLHTTGDVQGGHEYLLSELDVENQRIWMDNSWGTSWGVHGRAYFTWDDFRELLSKDGDCTVFTPIDQPAPVPTPPPAPTPVPPQPEPTDGGLMDEFKNLLEDLKVAVARAEGWLKAHMN